MASVQTCKNGFSGKSGSNIRSVIKYADTKIPFHGKKELKFNKFSRKKLFISFSRKNINTFTSSM